MPTKTTSMAVQFSFKYRYMLLGLFIMFINSVSVSTTKGPIDFMFPGTIQIEEVNESDTLRLAFVLHRHGDRAPVTLYKNDPNANISDTVWPGGLGELTKRGKLMEYDLGQWLRRRFKTFIDSAFNPEQVYIYSTDYDRTLMSSQCVLASFYYPNEQNRFLPGLAWMPTPIHSLPKEDDKLLNNEATCPRICLEVVKMKELPQIKDYIAHHEDLFKFLSKESGNDISTIDNVNFLYDTLKIEKLYNLTVPQWFLTHEKEMESISNFAFKTFTYTLELKRLRGGPLMHFMTTQMSSKIQGKLPDQKMYMFSAHDTTVATLLNSMGVFNDIMPPYAATVLVELHQMDSRYVVKVFYQNDSSMAAPAHQLFLPGCTGDCTYEDWVRVTQKVIPVDWDWECYRPDPIRQHKIILTMTGLVVTAVVLIILVSLFYYCKGFPFCKGKSVVTYQPLTSEEDCESKTGDMASTRKILLQYFYRGDRQGRLPLQHK